MRTESDRPTRNGGWLHRLTDAPESHRSSDLPRRYDIPFRLGPDWTSRVRQRVSETTDEQLHDLAQTLGLAGIGTLRHMDVFWSWRCVGWGFPMRDQHGAVRGIRVRLRDGKKLAVTGSREGVFLPADLTSTGPLLLPEGASDAAVALDLGFPAIGRPSAMGGIRQLPDLVVGRDVVIVADRDEVGQRGAQRLASAVICQARSLVVICPPAKDLRVWYGEGATREDVEALIQQAEERSLHVGGTS